MKKLKKIQQVSLEIFSESLMCILNFQNGSKITPTATWTYFGNPNL